MKSVETCVPDYVLRLVCALYQYFFKKIAVLSYNFCFEFISSYVLIHVCTNLHNYIHTAILIKIMIQKEGMDLVNRLLKSLQVFEMSMYLGLFYSQISHWLPELCYSTSHQRQFTNTSIATLFLVKGS